MSRSEYSDDCDSWELIMWRGAVASAAKGARGQRLFNELLAAMDAMPEKRLIAESLEAGGEVCALGCVGRARGIAMETINPENYDRVAEVFDIAPALAREIVYENDEASLAEETPEQRWVRMRRWVVGQILKEHAAAKPRSEP